MLRRVGGTGERLGLVNDLHEVSLTWERRLHARLRAAADAHIAQRAIRLGHRPKPAHLLTGERGEDAAFFHLRERGYTVVARRWTSARVRGDLDLVAWDGDTLVFVEVKTRTARDLAPAETAVDRDKQTQLRRLARAWIRQLPRRYQERVGFRFDVVSVYMVGQWPEVEHFRNAFPVSAPSRPRWRAF